MSEFLAFVLAGVLSNLQSAANPERPDLTEAQVQGLRAKNIFSPFRTKPFPKKPEPGSSSSKGPETKSEPTRPKPLVLTGIVYDASSKGFQAIVEDKNDEKLRRLTGPRFLKAGDEVLGVKIEAVEKDKAIVVLGEARKELAAGDALPEVAPEGASSSANPGGASEGKPAPAPTPTVESKPVEPEAVNSVLEELKKKNKKKDRKYDEP